MQTWRIEGICVSPVVILKAYWKDIGKKMIGCNLRNKCLGSRTFSLQGKAKRLAPPYCLHCLCEPNNNNKINKEIKKEHGEKKKRNLKVVRSLRAHRGLWAKLPAS